jgi:hypothetical protein
VRTPPVPGLLAVDKSHNSSPKGGNADAIRQRLRLQWFETLQAFPPMQAPETYNLSGILDQMKKGAHGSD